MDPSSYSHSIHSAEHVSPSINSFLDPLIIPSFAASGPYIDTDSSSCLQLDYDRNQHNHPNLAAADDQLYILSPASSPQLIMAENEDQFKNMICDITSSLAANLEPCNTYNNIMDMFSDEQCFTQLTDLALSQLEGGFTSAMDPISCCHLYQQQRHASSTISYSCSGRSIGTTASSPAEEKHPLQTLQLESILAFMGDQIKQGTTSHGPMFSANLSEHHIQPTFTTREWFSDRMAIDAIHPANIIKRGISMHPRTKTNNYGQTQHTKAAPSDNHSPLPHFRQHHDSVPEVTTPTQQHELDQAPPAKSLELAKSSSADHSPKIKSCKSIKDEIADDSNYMNLDNPVNRTTNSDEYSAKIVKTAPGKRLSTTAKIMPCTKTNHNKARKRPRSGVQDDIQGCIINPILANPPIHQTSINSWNIMASSPVPVKRGDGGMSCSNKSSSPERNIINKNNNNMQQLIPPDVVHVRARRGQATDSHSLAERVRRERISQRMKLLQELVPGCNKVLGKAVMLEEIINYVKSLQQQVEFLSMKLASSSI